MHFDEMKNAVGDMVASLQKTERISGGLDRMPAYEADLLEILMGAKQRLDYIQIQPIGHSDSGVPINEIVDSYPRVPSVFIDAMNDSQ